MRVELDRNNRWILCGRFLKDDQIKEGQVWAGSGAGTVTVVHVDEDEMGDTRVTYEWEQGGTTVRHSKDAFNFQCRYCLVLPSMEIPEIYWGTT